MSHFIFGTFNFAAPMSQSEQSGIGFKLAAEALSKRLYLRLHENAALNLIFEMLALTPGTIPHDRMIFIVTASPIRDTSDELISPYVIGLEGSDTSLGVSLLRIRQFLTAACKIEEIESITVWMSEGFDIEFQEFVVSPDAFDDLAMKVLAPEFLSAPPHLTSTRFVVRCNLGKGGTD
jgi:hypothetical protein